MKQTIAELGIGGEGWMIYDNHILPERVVHIEVIDNFSYDPYSMKSQFLLRELLEYDGIKTTRDLVVFANEIVYSTKEEAMAKLQEQVNKTITPTEQKSVDWEKLLSKLDSIQKQFSEITEGQKKDFYTFIKKLRNITNPQPDDINWKQVRINAAISVLNAQLKLHNMCVTEKSISKEFYAKIAVEYADKLVYELKRSEALFEEKLKEI